MGAGGLSLPGPGSLTGPSQLGVEHLSGASLGHPSQAKLPSCLPGCRLPATPQVCGQLPAPRARPLRLLRAGGAALLSSLRRHSGQAIVLCMTSAGLALVVHNSQLGTDVVAEIAQASGGGKLQAKEKSALG